MERVSGYVDCKCRDCFRWAVADDMSKGAFCNECEDAGCTTDGVDGSADDEIDPSESN